jgi:predicted signal transduction protein with EAL and GGDEF domain
MVVSVRRATRDDILMIILGIAFFTDIVAINMFLPAIRELIVVGWMVFGIGVLFYVMSVLTLACINTDMYLGAMTMFFSHILLGQNWIAAIGSIVAIVCCYMIILSGDQRNIEKFGDNYKRYMQKVPRMNLFLGISRLLRRRRKHSQEENANSMRDEDVE